MKKLRILVLIDENEVPPETREELGENIYASRVVYFELVEALRTLDHDVRVQGVADELAPIRHAIHGWQPHVVFNLLLHFHGVALYDAHVVSYLELLKTPYTGCNPRGILLSSDKALAKKILSYHRIPTPRFLFVAQGRKPRVPQRMRYPLFVKTGQEHGSIGISQASLCKTEEQLHERVKFVHERLDADAIVEEYVDGRELTLSIVGNDRLTTFPVWELSFNNLPDGTAPIATSRVKWDEKYQQKLGVKSGPASDLSDEEQRAIARLGKRVYRALGLSGYARLDLRMDAERKVHVIEANPNPDLANGEDLASAAQAVGIDYPALLQRIVGLGLAYRPGWKG